jgi:hypothetical protein
MIEQFIGLSMRKLEARILLTIKEVAGGLGMGLSSRALA